MKALNSLIAAIFLLLGGAWVAEASAQPGPGSPKYDPSKNPSIHNCPGYGLTRRAHGGVCPPPPGKPNGMAVGGMPGANAGQPISLSQPSPGTAGAVNSGSGPQGKPKSLVPGPPFKGAQPAKQPARRSVSDLFFDEDTGSSFLRRAESSNEPLLSQRTPSAEDTALLRRQAALDIYIREALEAAKLDNMVSSRSVPSTDHELFKLQSRDAQPDQEAGYDNALWSRVAAQAEQDLHDLFGRSLSYGQQSLEVRSPEAANDIGVYSREATYDDQPLWGRSPSFYEESQSPVW